MTLDERARSAADSVRTDLGAIPLPQPGSVLRRARRRRRIGVSTTALVAAAIVATVVILNRPDAAQRILVTGPPPTILPAGAVTHGDWTMIPKPASGIGRDASLSALESDGSSLMLAGATPSAAGNRVTMWWSDDGVHWMEAETPTWFGSVATIAGHDGTALAIGGGSNQSFVWRSHDHGRHWEEIAVRDPFGAPAPRSRPSAWVTGLLWSHGWWIAYGGAADGYEGIWISRDGAKWSLVLDSRSSGSIDSIVETPDGLLAAYGINSTANPARTLEIGWFTNDPTSWGGPANVTTPRRFYIGSVAPGAKLAIGVDLDKNGAPTPVLRSADGGRTWTKDATFETMFPHAYAFSVSSEVGVDVVAGTNTGADAAKVWLSPRAGTWLEGPAGFVPPQTPTTSIPYIPPKGSLDLAASVGKRIVFMGLARELDRYYTYEVPS